MKVKELIERLQEVSQELDITDGDAALYKIEIQPAYYDGCFTRLIQNNSVNGAEIVGVGLKVKLVFLSWKDVLDNNHNAIIQYDDISKDYKDIVKKHLNLHSYCIMGDLKRRDDTMYGIGLRCEAESPQHAQKNFIEHCTQHHPGDTIILSSIVVRE